MNPERWQRVQRLFEEALAQPAESRSAFIVSACGSETELRDELLSLLAAQERGGNTESIPAAWLGALGTDQADRVGPRDVNRLMGQLNAALSGRYAFQRELGSGGMATVFLADDLRHHRLVAIKVLHGELGAAIGRERFLREIEIAAGLHHAHILPVYDSGIAGDLLYFVMPYAEGESLRQRLEREKQLPLDDALQIAREVADALDYAHRHGVVHRDIKPENILLQDGHAVVADFGIARAVVAGGDRKLTTTGVVIGTPAYMSPEQGIPGQELDGRSDLYALGCVAYEMLAGQPPFTGPTAESLAHQHLNVPARPVTDLRPAVPTKIARAIQRTLAKTPADRFTTASEFAAAIESGAELDAPEAAPAALRRRLVVATASAAAIVFLGLAAWRIAPSLLHRTVPNPANKAWILVAEFDGPPADSTVVAATRDLVMAALDESEIVATVPRDQIRVALQNAGKPPSTRVDVDVAREIAYRTSVRTVLAGSVGRIGRGYSIVLRVVDADSARVLVSVTDGAPDEEALMPAVGRIAKRLREKLGERRTAIQATRDLDLSITPSFEAYKALVRGRAQLFALENRAAITWFRSALALDPDFANAWGSMGYALYYLGEADSALSAFQEALARPARLSATSKLYSRIQIAYLSGDLPGTLALSEKLVQLVPERWTAHNNRSDYLSSAGRFSEALDCARTAEKVSPFGATQQVLINQFRDLLWIGRVDEARPLVPRLRGGLAQEAPMHLAAAAGQWSAAEGLATVLKSAPSVDDDIRRRAAAFLAAAQSSRGQVRAADQTLRQAQSEAETADQSLLSTWTRWDRLRLALFSRGVAVDPGSPGRWDSTTAGLVAHGAWAAATGDTTLARRLLATIRKRSGPDLARQGFGPELVEGWIAARAGRWEEVQRILGPLAPQGEAKGYVLFRSAPLVRWLAAEAYERLGRADSAAACFERAMAPVPEGGMNIEQVRMASSFAHRRLVLLAARAGRVEEARRHWEMFSKAFTNPDPELVPMVEEARLALASAEAMPRSARR